MDKVFLLLGSNLGDRKLVLKEASALITQQVGLITQTSSCYETAPWGVLEQPVFLNQVLAVETMLTPEKVLTAILAIEKALGRVRFERWGARTIDIDILYYNNMVVQQNQLTIPHPSMHQRRFTLVPLHEIAPDFIHPILHKSNHQLLSECTDTGSVILIS